MSETKRTFTPSPEQQAFLDWIKSGNGSCVLEAVAGAGKTTTLVEGVKLMPGSVFLGAYNKKMGEELKARIKGLQGKFAGTFHSAGYSALRRANPKVEIDDKKVRNLVEDHIEHALHRDPVDGEVTAACQLVSLAKQTGFFISTLVPQVRPAYWAELINRYDVADRLPDDYNPHALAQIANVVLERSNKLTNIIDFDDMVYMPLLLNLHMFRNDWVLIDEAQDTNAVRRELAARMLRPGGRLVAVGDPHQAIYGFTGADNSSLDLIRERFNATTLRLSVSWRCPRSVVAYARKYVDHIAAAPTAPEGEVVTGEAYKAMLANVAPGTAVLCRFNAPLVELCFRLIRDGKPAKIEGRAIGEGLAALVGRWKVKTLDAFEAKLEKWNDREVEKIKANPKGVDEAKLARHEDKYSTILVLVERGREKGLTKVDQLQDMIRDMFADVGADRTLVVLSSVHRSKGLEWPVVRVLGLNEVMPSPRASQQWQKEQEINLCYVAVTRAQSTLIDVRMPTPEDLKRPNVAKKEETADAA